MGVTVNIDGKGIEIATTEDITKQFASLYDWISNSTLREEVPKALEQNFTTPAGASTYTYLDLGTPLPGWLWDVMRIAFSGNDPTATVAGNVWAFLGAVPPNGSTIALYPEIFEVPSATIPNQAFYGRQQVIARPGQHVVIAFKGLPNATTVRATGLAIQYRDPSAGTPLNTYRRPK